MGLGGIEGGAGECEEGRESVGRKSKFDVCFVDSSWWPVERGLVLRCGCLWGEVCLFEACLVVCGYFPKCEEVIGCAYAVDGALGDRRVSGNG